MCLQIPGTTSVNSVLDLSALAATLSSTDESTQERSPCSEFQGPWRELLSGSQGVGSRSPQGCKGELSLLPISGSRCEICGFTCRQKASLNWHRRKHAETAAALRFPCEFCGKRFEKPDSVVAHCSKSHPALLPAQESPSSLGSSPSISAPEPLQSPEGASFSTSSDSNPAPSTSISSSGVPDPRNTEKS